MKHLILRRRRSRICEVGDIPEKKIKIKKMRVRAHTPLRAGAGRKRKSSDRLRTGCVEGSFVHIMKYTFRFARGKLGWDEGCLGGFAGTRQKGVKKGEKKKGKKGGG